MKKRILIVLYLLYILIINQTYYCYPCLLKDCESANVAQFNCIVTLSIYVDNICICWETDQKCSPKTLIGSVIVSVHASSAVDRGLESRSGQTKDYQLVLVAYNAKHAELRRKSKDGLLRNQDNVSEWSDMYIRRLLFPLANTMKKN
jgi:hypothetical protein